MSDTTHALRRTSPKGKGQKFVGVCTKCGREGLTFAHAEREECPNVRGVSQEQALLEAIKGYSHD